MASVAATQEEALAISACEAANVKFRFLLRSDNSTTGDPEWSLEKLRAWVNGDEDTKVTKGEEPKQPETPTTEPKTETVKMTVPLEDLKAGTELTNELVQAKFKEVPVIGAAPANAVLNIKEHVGRFLTKDVAAEQFVPKSYIADAIAKVTPDTKPDIKPLVPEVEVKKLPTFDRAIGGPSGWKTFRYEIQESGEKKLLGEVTPDGSIVPVTPASPAAPATPAAPTNPKKDI
jgi:hypothetical protein